MGMSASQVNLLSLTGRLHDIEYRAQHIESQKIQLATQKDELYQRYCDALDAKKIQVAYNNGDGSRSYIDATFATLCNYNEDRIKQYSLKDARTGKVYVDSTIKEMYEEFDNDKYSFAFGMLGMERNFSWQDEKNLTDPNAVGQGNLIGFSSQEGDLGDGVGVLFMTEVERMVYNNHSTDEKLSKAYSDLMDANNSSSSIAEKNDALDKFRDLLYKNYGHEIYQYMRLNKEIDSNTDPNNAAAEFDDYPEEYPKSEFNFYVRLFEEIEASGGCLEIDPLYVSGEEGNDWLNNMVKTGRVIIDVYEDKKGWVETNVATSTNQNYLQEVQDETDLKKAEAEYEHELDVVNRKDTKFDQDLSKLETERTAITTEIDSIKKVKDDNIQRTFGIFS